MDRKEELKRLLSNANALLEAMRYSTATSSGEYADIGRWTSFGTFLRKYNELAERAAPLLTNPTMLDKIDIDKIPASASRTWPGQKELFELAYSNIALLKSLIEGVVPDKEFDIQNGIEALLAGRGMAKGTEYDRETGA
jgi:hypothetical protein